MAGEIARDGISTWQWLCDAGGIEIRGRDADFAEALRVALRPSAPTLEDALRETSTDDFISAFFSVAEPFVTMFQAILQFFEAAEFAKDALSGVSVSRRSNGMASGRQKRTCIPRVLSSCRSACAKQKAA